jgi:putative phosphonate metabolism protein
MSARYAVYFAPAVDSDWWRFGAGWLGRDDVRGQELPQPLLHGIPREDFHTITAEPRRYGFHATLKAPFALRDGSTEHDLRARVDGLAAQMQAVELGDLQPSVIARFVALVPEGHRPGLHELAARCVMDLDELRAPMTAEDLARRQAAGLTSEQRELLERYGYPHVLHHFLFHMTLSARVDPATADRLVQGAHTGLARLGPLRLDRLCLFREEHAGAPFLRVHERELRP